MSVILYEKEYLNWRKSGRTYATVYFDQQRQTPQTDIFIFPIFHEIVQQNTHHKYTCSYFQFTIRSFSQNKTLNYTYILNLPLDNSAAANTINKPIPISNLPIVDQPKQTPETHRSPFLLFHQLMCYQLASGPRQANQEESGA